MIWLYFIFFSLFIYSYVHTLYTLFGPFLLPTPSPPTPFASRQNMFCPLLQFCWWEDISTNKKDVIFLLVWGKDSYTERFLALLPCTCVLQPELIHLYQTSYFLVHVFSYRWFDYILCSFIYLCLYIHQHQQLRFITQKKFFSIISYVRLNSCSRYRITESKEWIILGKDQRFKCHSNNIFKILKKSIMNKTTAFQIKTKFNFFLLLQASI
jgi:hypothetical protein